MKCYRCGIDKAEAAFSPNNDACKPCKAEQARQWRERNKDKVAAYQKAYAQSQSSKEASLRYRTRNRARVLENARAWYMANREKRLAYYVGNEKIAATRKRYRENNKEREAARVAAYAKAHPERARATTARYRARKQMAVAKWANESAIAAIYKDAARVSLELGVPHSVDHIVPVQGRTVCGLHVEYNLRVIPSVLNSAKGNKLLPELLAA